MLQKSYALVAGITSSTARINLNKKKIVKPFAHDLET